MRSNGLVLFFLLLGGFLYAQEELQPVDSLKKVDYKYREDQFYFGITHTILQAKPPKLSQRSVSLGIQAGFLRDFPVNKERNWSIAPGIGYSSLNLHHNMATVEINDIISYPILDSYKQNAVTLHYLDFPLEVRWRTSTPYSHKFWRIYTGFKASYLLGDKSVSKSDLGSLKVTNNADLNKWVFGVYVAAGFNTWNVYMYYGLNSIYKNNLSEVSSEKLNAFNVGLMFYIL